MGGGGGGVVREKWMGFRDIYEQKCAGFGSRLAMVQKKELANVTPRFLAEAGHCLCRCTYRI